MNHATGLLEFYNPRSSRNLISYSIGTDGAQTLELLALSSWSVGLVGQSIDMVRSGRSVLLGRCCRLLTGSYSIGTDGAHVSRSEVTGKSKFFGKLSESDRGRKNFNLAFVILMQFYNSAFMILKRFYSLLLLALHVWVLVSLARLHLAC